jgi:hypothetical protein
MGTYSMKKEEWNPEDWQGKTKDQVEFSLAMAFLGLLVIGIVAVFLVLTQP